MNQLKFDYREQIRHLVCKQTWFVVNHTFVYQQVSSEIDRQLYHQIWRQVGGTQ